MSTLKTAEYRQRYQTLTSKTDIEQGKLEAYKETLDGLRVKIQKVEKAVELHGHECDALRIVSEILRERIRARVEHLTTLAVRSVFGKDDYRFELEMEPKRGQMTATPMFASRFKDQEIVVPVKDARGGGIVNVVSFVLREVVRALTRPRVAPVSIGDETFKNVSREYLPKIAQLLQKLHDTTGVQFIIVTHKSELAEIGKVFHVSKDAEGLTIVEEG